jgi:hypothetical protein
VPWQDAASMMTVGEQIAEIRQAARRKVSARLGWALWPLCAGLCIGGLRAGEWLYFLCAGFAAIVAYSSHQAAPHISAAVRALDEGEQHQCATRIEVESWSDSDTYTVLVFMPNAMRWRFDFVPLGWKPQAGIFQSTVYCLTEPAWPVLVRFDEGIAIPRAKPRLDPP